MNKDDALEKKAENAKELGLDYEPEPYKGISDHITQAIGGRAYVDPVTGNVSVGTPQRKPLTDEEIGMLWPLRPTDEIVAFARAIEAAHGIKGEA